LAVGDPIINMAKSWISLTGLTLSRFVPVSSRELNFNRQLSFCVQYFDVRGSFPVIDNS
jgi:hypothetical protein